MTINHRPVGCAMAGKFPQLQASFAPAADLAIARILFQAEGAQWYSVKMKPEGTIFTGVLPRPRKSLESFPYYIEVTDKALATFRTIQYAVAVVDSPSACKGRLLAGQLTSASVLLQGPPGVAATPSGFATSGVVTVAGPAPIAAATAGETSSTGAPRASDEPGAGATSAVEKKASTASVPKRGGGIGATALILGGLGVAGGAVAVAASQRGSEDPTPAAGNSGTPPSSGQPVSYDVFFVPSLDGSVCARSALTTAMFGSLRVTPDSTGTFNNPWPISTPVVRVVGQALSTMFQATLTCAIGGSDDLNGAISALAGDGGGYRGEYKFAGRGGQVAITRAQ